MYSSLAARILIVDDNESDRHALVEFLRRQGGRLFIGENGRDGFEKARYVEPDLILMDIRMPECDGIAACRLLKADPKTAHIPLIFLTAASSPEDRISGLSEGAVDYITKPFNFDEVRLRVSIHLGLSQKNRGSRAAEHVPIVKGDSVDTIVFKAAQRILMQDLSSTPMLAKLARAVGTNSKRLNEAFKKCAGATVFDYLHEIRMKEARRQLAETNLDVGTIASDLGYGKACNFSTAFRLRFGMTPREYRKSPGEEFADE